MTPEQKQRIEQIESGDQEWRKTAYELGDVLAGHEGDIEFLLSLVKSQEGDYALVDKYLAELKQELGLPPNAHASISLDRYKERVANSMHSACVEKVAETHDSVESACNAALMDVYDLSIANAPMPAKDCREIADCIGHRVGQIRKAIAALTEELESLSVEKPKE